MRVSRFLPIATAVCLSFAPAALAQVSIFGDVQPADNPFTLGLSEGLQGDGATVDVGSLAFPPDENGNFPDVAGDGGVGPNLGQPFFEQNLNVVIGENSFGQVEITSGAILRNGHLVLGGAASTDTAIPVVDGDEPPEETTSGTGVLRIVGTGSTFNNHPRIIPSQFQQVFDDGGTPGDASDDTLPNVEATIFTIPNEFGFGDLNGDGTFNGPGEVFEAGTIARPGTVNTPAALPSVGFDAFIGLTGSGVLEIVDGGRAEIEDGVILGFGNQASGTVLVSGAGSTLTNFGGINPTSATIDSDGISQLIVGGLGQGSLTIENGGLVQALRGAAIGALESSGDSDEDELGGSGFVVVDGPGSRFDITVSDGLGEADDAALAIGEFVEAEDPTTLEPINQSDAGQGLLTISNGGLVRVLGEEDDANDGDLRIGRFGELALQAGAIEVQGNVLSDGVVGGDGELQVGRFVNRSLGEVVVSSGETLTIRADFDVAEPLPANEGADGVIITGDPGDTDNLGSFVSPTAITNFFAANFGSIQVTGSESGGQAEFVFERADEAPVAGTELRFWNARRDATSTPGTGDDEFGEIIVSDAILRFRSGTDLTGTNDGLLNSGLVAFVGGTNLVTGTVENDINGEINVVGPTTGGDPTFVTFADAVVNTGLFTVTNADVVLLPGSSAYSGAGALTLTGASTVTVAGDFQLGDGAVGGSLDFNIVNGELPTLIVTGDFLLDAGATLDLDGILSPLDVVPGTTLDLITVEGAANDLLDDPTALSLLSLPTLADPDLAATIGVDGAGSLVLAIESISAIGAIGADFNGDGVVDDSDLDVFSQFFGLESGGSILTGDANGDGAVNAADFFFLQEQFGGAPTVIAASVTVPEPGAIGLLAIGLMTLGGRRRRV